MQYRRISANAIAFYKMNVTCINLQMRSIMFLSPLFSASFKFNISIYRSRFTQFAQPLFHTTRPGFISIQNFKFDIATSPVVQTLPQNCQYVAELSGGYIYVETCIYVRKGIISNIQTNLSAPFCLENTNLLLLEVQMTNCSGELSGCAYCNRGTIDITLSSISECYGALAGISSSMDAAITIESCQFTKCSSPFVCVDGGSLNISHLRLYDDSAIAGSLLQINNSLWNTLKFLNVSTASSLSAINLSKTPNTLIQASAFFGFPESVLSMGSGCYVVVRDCCFGNARKPVVSRDDQNLTLYLVIKNVVNSTECLFLSPTTAEISERTEEFGILTCTVFFVFFGIVWVGVIVFVFIKIGNYAAVKYQILHDDEEEDDPGSD